MTNLLENHPKVVSSHTVNQPAKYQGTDEDIANNKLSHRWVFDGSDKICSHCDVKSWYTSAEYPCGTWDIPREDVTTITFSDGSVEVITVPENNQPLAKEGK